MPLLLIGGIWLILTLFVTMGMASTSRPVSGGFVNWLIQQAGKVPLLGGFTIDQIISLDRWINNKLGKHFQAIEDTGVKWLYGLAHYVYIVGYWSLYWPIGLHHAITHQNTVAVPNAIRARTKPLSHRVDVAEAQAKAAAGAAHANTVVIRKGGTVKEITKIERVAMPHAGEWDWIHDHYGTLKKVVLGVAAGAAGVALPHAPSLPVPWGKTVKQIRRQIKRLDGLTVPIAVAAALATVMRLGSVRCLTTGPVGKVARRLCGLSARALEDVLGLLVDLFLLSNICQAIVLIEDGFSFIEPEITAFITAVETMACYGNDEHLPPGPPVFLSLPPVTGLVLPQAA